MLQPRYDGTISAWEDDSSAKDALLSIHDETNASTTISTTTAKQGSKKPEAKAQQAPDNKAKGNQKNAAKYKTA